MAQCDNCYHKKVCKMFANKFLDMPLRRVLNGCKHYIPTANVEEVKRGEWIVDGDITECSNCHKEYVTARGMLQLKEFDYCPKCGANMDGGKTE